MQAPFVIDEAHPGGADDVGVGDADFGQGAFEIVGPEIQKLDEPGELRSEIVVLPDEGLQNVAEVRHAVHDFRRRQTPATQLNSKPLSIITFSISFSSTISRLTKKFHNRHHTVNS